jgi:hypothetical protein
MKSKIFFVSLFMMVLTVACSPVVETANPVGSNESEENNANQSAEAVESNDLFADDFSNANSGWDRNEWEDGFTDYVNNAYRVFVGPENYSVWANPSRNFVDTSVTVTATKVGGDDNNEFGIICRYADIENFYVATISSDGFYGFLNIEGGEYSLLNMEQMLPVSAINQGNAANTMRLDCIGNTLTLYVNGDFVGETVDDRIASGDVGLYAGTFDVPGTEILFDDFVVTAP